LAVLATRVHQIPPVASELRGQIFGTPTHPRVSLDIKIISSDAKLATQNGTGSDQGLSASAYFQSKKFVRLASVHHIASVMSANTQPGDGSLGSPRPHPVPERPTKRQKIAVACDACRTRKVKCDGIRPSESCSPWILV
jgi:hypothetical protein